jgi:hypothetical protein
LTPQQPSPTTTPQQPNAPAPASPNTNFGEAPSAGTAAGGSYFTNVFGDRFGSAGRSVLVLQQPRQFGVLFGVPESSANPTRIRILSPQGTDQFLATGRIPAGTGFFLTEPVNANGVQALPATIPLLVNQPNITPSLTAPAAGEPTLVTRNGTAEFLKFLQQNGAFFNVSYVEQTRLLLNIPNPGSGGVVGRQKTAEDSNPLPRDRLLFNYDYFNSTPLSVNGLDVNRFVFGAEKTFLDQRASVEVRVPFASTLNSDMVAGAEGRHTEFGNVRVTPRLLLWREDAVSLGTGLSIHLPTADDTRVFLPSGREVARIENGSVVLSPYLAVLFTPNPRLFAQAWAAVDVDTTGSPAFADVDGRGLREVGRLTDATYLQFDLQLGYWLYQSEERQGTGLAPFAELHYGTTAQDADLISAGSFAIGDLNRRADELNLAVGLIARTGPRSVVSVGAVVPLRGRDDRSFDYQIGVRASVFFGPTARTPGASPSGF